MASVKTEINPLLTNFSDSALKVVQLAEQERLSLGHDMTGTEHLLLGLLSHESCRTSVILRSMGITVQKAQEEVLRIMRRGSETAPDFTFTARAKETFKLTHEKTYLSEDSKQVEPETILAAMMSMPRCTAQKVFHALDVNVDHLLMRIAAEQPKEDQNIGEITIDQLADIHKRVISGSIASDEDELDDALEDLKDPMLGYIIDRKYEVESVIGRGGMGVVYKVKHLILDRYFAIKVIHPYLATDAKNRRRFQREAQAASRLTHPNLAAVFDWDIMEDGRPYLVMYYIDGAKLSDLVRIRKTVTMSSWLSIFMQICDALAHAHERGVLHRDLKPGNVILSNDEDTAHFVKIVDFGIAKILHQSNTEQKELTQSGEVMGSPHYMSPEQCLGNPLDVRSDIYSLGCVMYECLTGFCPFYGNSMYETMTMHVKNTAAVFKTIDPESKVSMEVETIVQRCLAKNPDHRYQSMKSLKRALIIAHTSN